MVSLVKHDLEFILKQIKIAEAHSGGTPLSDIRVDAQGNVTTDAAAPLALSDPLAPYGLRTVDGSYNNLVEGRDQWGAADESFPRLTDPYWRNEGDDAMTFGAGANTFPLTNNNYAAAGAPPPASMGLGGGTVVDADPRLISNLIVDQTLGNPAAVYAALVHAGVTGAAITAAMQAIAAANAPYESAAAAAASAEAAMEAAQDAVDAARAAYVASGDPADAAALSAAIGVSIDAIQASAEAADAAQEARADLDAVLAQHGVEMDGKSVVIPNVAPDEGLSAPYNSWFTLFGQFFDHGLDLVAKSGNGTVYIPLQPDDPLYNPASPHTNFMALTRTSQGAPNLTTPWVDQNQTYGSTASKQLFMREYAMVDGKPVATGKLLEGADGGLATWKDVKDQAREKLGVLLTDANIGNIPLFVMDDYGEFVRGPNGFPQIVRSLGADGLFGGGDDVFEEGNPAAPISAVNAVLTGHAFLDDIAHAAAPVLAGGVLQADGDEAVGYANADGSAGPVSARGSQTAYDNELLDAHFITGDGRGNENIGLTAVHHVFHSEHNHTVDQVKVRAVEAAMAGDLAFLNEWLAVDIAGSVALPAADASPAEILAFAQALSWDGERLFQAARFTTEMQYQHLVFEEFARKVQPDVDAFVFNPSMDINPAIFAEFAHVVYRFGHSMLNETVDRTYEDGTAGDLDLFSAFLNPVAFSGVQRDESGAVVLGQDGQPIVLDAAAAAGAIARGMTAQRGNEIDEFVTDVLRNQLLGIPLDLAALNIARGRETGIPPLNEARRQFQEIASGDTQLAAYESWTDFALNLKNPASIVNFIAAYGTHATITGAGTAAAKRAAATALVFGAPGLDEGDRQAFLNGTGTYANRLGGLEDVDLWVGGLAEKKMAFGGMLGSTFSFIFELQLENLQNADRFYYLSRVQGLNFLNELENNSLAKMVLNNTDLGESGFAVPGDIFSVPDHVLYVDKAMQVRFGYADPEHDDPFLEAVSKMVERVDADGDGVAEYLRVNTNDHVLVQGTDGNDVIVAGGGDDSVWGRGGNDRIEAGYGVDKIHGGTGDDIITNSGTDIGEVDMLHGEEGNDVIHGGSGLALIFGNQGQDVIVTGPDGKEAFGGTGDDFILGGDGGDFLLGNEGDDWIEGGNGFDTTAGDNSELFFNSTIIGHDVMFAGQNEHDFDAESGDDIMVQGESVMRNEGMLGFDWAIHKGNTEAADSDLLRPIFTTDVQDILRDRFDAVEALSGWDNDDVLKGDDRAAPNAGGEAPPNPNLAGAENTMDGHQLTQAGVDRIEGLRELLGDLIAAAPTIVDPETIVAFEAGNILLGGGGSDQITGRGGDDLIDGDRWLNVRIRFVEDGVAYTADTLGGSIWREADYADGKPIAGAVAQFAGKSLVSLTLDGTVNPGQLSIHREIAEAAPNDAGIDTAVYADAWANYTLTRNVDGSVTLDHTGFGNDVTVTVSDGRDRLHNIERLQFSDRTIYLTDVAATGTVLISDPTPTETRTVTATISDLVDLNGATNPALSFQWQRSADGGSTWTTIAGATAASYTPNQASVGQILRARVSFTDDMGFAEELFSAPTGIVGDLITGTAQNNTLTGTAGDDIISGNGGNDTLNGLAGADELSGGTGNDTINGGDGADLIEGGTGDDAINGGAGDDTVVWNAQLGFFTVNRDGRDVVNGGTEDGAGDTFVANGAALFSETFSIYTRAAAQTTFGYAGTAEIVIRHSFQPVFGAVNTQIIAELTDIEEIRINAAVVSSGTPANGSSGGDTIQVFGDFTQTSLNLNTITIGGSAGDDVVDITGLTSAHRIVFKSNGGNDTIVGTLRPQDVIDLPPGASLATYSSTQNGNGTTTFSNGSHSITFASSGMPTFAEMPAEDDDAGSPVEDEDDTPVCGGSTLEPAPEETTGTLRSGTSGSDVLAGTIGADNIVGFAGDDVLLGEDGDDALSGGAGDDFIDAGAGRDTVFAGDGDDQVFGGAGADMLYGDAGADRIFGGAGDDFITAGAGDDTVVAGAGNDLIVAEIGDGNDTYFGDEAGGGAGIDTLDMSLITAAVTVDLGTGLTGKGSAVSAQTGTDTLWSIENVVTGSGADTITASVAVNVMDGGAGADTFRFTSTAAADGDTIVAFEPGDRLDFSAIDADAGGSGDQAFTLITSASFTAAGQLIVTYESRAEGAFTVIEGNVNGDTQADFRLEVQGTHALNNQNVVL